MFFKLKKPTKIRYDIDEIALEHGQSCTVNALRLVIQCNGVGVGSN